MNTLDDHHGSAAAERLHTHRQQFPALGNKVYFNFGGQGPLPQTARLAIQQAYDYIQQEGPFSGRALDWIVAQVAETRQAIAAELSVAPDTISLTESVSVGCNIALWGIDWHSGDHLLLSDCEHPGIVAAANQLQQRFGVEVSTFPLQSTLNGGDPVAIVAEHLRPTTRLVVVSHILWNTGQVLPLKEMVQVCHTYASRPVAVLVDAAQSVGVLPLDLQDLGADFYAFTGHKWWCGPDGLGGLYVHPQACEQLHPTFIGWRGIVSNEFGTPIGWKPDGRRFEVATSAFPLCAGLRTALQLHQTWGTAMERYQRICALSQYLWQQLQSLSGLQCLRQTPPQAGLISFQIGGFSSPISNRQHHVRLVQWLEAQHLLVRLILAPHCVRACVHYFSLESECDRLVAALDEFLNSICQGSI
uniref:Aminotransferase class V n=1 Tax=Cyanothece sp. (strain PCC 7425 / ATCC 29141) TaxID=395961 RepID=B8HPW4_CYAP4